jgi:hypothetical protein
METLMQVTLLLAADYANVAQGGKLNVMGIFDNIRAHKFPARHSLMHIVIKLAAELGENNETRTVTIKLVDQDGNELMKMSQNVQVPATIGGRRPELNIIMGLQDIKFPEPGTYEFVVLVDKDFKASRPVQLIQIEQPAAPDVPPDDIESA